MAKARRMTATVKMTFTEDTDLIGWWNTIPRGSRNAVMKDMMRDYIERNRGGFRPVMPRNLPQPFDPKRFTQVCDDAAWIRSALNDLPGYMERVIQHVAAMQPVGVAVGTYAREPTKLVDGIYSPTRADCIFPQSYRVHYVFLGFKFTDF